MTPIHKRENPPSTLGTACHDVQTLKANAFQGDWKEEAVQPGGINPRGLPGGGTHDIGWEESCFWRLTVSSSDPVSGWETLSLSGISEPVSITEGHYLLLPRLLGHCANCAEPAQPSLAALLMRNQKI